MYNILSVLGFIYILRLINENLYKLLPSIDVNDFFSRKLEIKEINSLKEYISAKIKLYKGLKNIKNLRGEDLSEFDLKSLNELEHFLKYEFSGYIKNLVNGRIVSNYMQCILDCGIFDFYLCQNNGFINDISIKFQSSSKDAPLLEISNTLNASYTYKFKSKYIRFLNPNIQQIDSIKEILRTMKLENINYFQAA